MEPRTNPDALVPIDRQGEHLTHPALCNRRFPPCSTFKLILALEGLDRGVVQGDAALRSALVLSSESYFRELADTLGAERMRATLQKLGYGSGWKGKRVADCWTDGTLRITPREQAALAAKLASGALPYKAVHQALVRDYLTVPETTVWGKTGTGAGIAWYVGAATVAGRPVAFAAFQQGKGVLGPQLRKGVVRLLMEETKRGAANRSGGAARAARLELEITHAQADCGRPRNL